jgi:hypothetical protein
MNYLDDYFDPLRGQFKKHPNNPCQTGIYLVLYIGAVFRGHNYAPESHSKAMM